MVIYIKSCLVVLGGQSNVHVCYYPFLYINKKTN